MDVLAKLAMIGSLINTDDTCDTYCDTTCREHSLGVRTKRKGQAPKENRLGTTTLTGWPIHMRLLLLQWRSGQKDLLWLALHSRRRLLRALLRIVGCKAAGGGRKHLRLNNSTVRRANNPRGQRSFVPAATNVKKNKMGE